MVVCMTMVDGNAADAETNTADIESFLRVFKIDKSQPNAVYTWAYQMQRKGLLMRAADTRKRRNLGVTLP